MNWDTTLILITTTVSLPHLISITNLSTCFLSQNKKQKMLFVKYMKQKWIIVSYKSPWLLASNIFLQLQFGLHVNAFLHVDVSWDLLSELFEFPKYYQYYVNLPLLAVRFVSLSFYILLFTFLLSFHLIGLEFPDFPTVTYTTWLPLTTAVFSTCLKRCSEQFNFLINFLLICNICPENLVVHQMSLLTLVSLYRWSVWRCEQKFVDCYFV